MNTIQNNAKMTLEYMKTLLKWVMLGAMVGILGGFIGSIFHLCIDYATEFRGEHSWVLYFLPVGGLVITGLYSIAKKQGRMDTNRVLEAVRTEEKVPFVMAPLIFVSTVITHLFGGSAGREGAALQLGGSIGYRMGKIFRLNREDLHLIVMAGMSAVFSALFGTPLTATFFAVEVVSVGIVHYAALVPCMTAALSAYGVAQLMGIKAVRFLNITFPALSLEMALKVAGMALLCAIIGILFCTALKLCEHGMEKFLPNKYIRTVVGALILILLTHLLGTYAYNGAGMDGIEKALMGEARPEAFLLKILFTTITISAGFKGGEIVPAFFIGSTFGCVASGILGLPAGVGASIGFVALFCSVVNCPVASLLLALEVFGGEGIWLFAVACTVSYMMSGCSGLYRSQKIMYSKLDGHYMDIFTN